MAFLNEKDKEFLRRLREEGPDKGNRYPLRKLIELKCKDCIYDDLAAGTWRQQVHLCSCYNCPLWPVRAKTHSPIPQSVLNYYGIEPDDPCLSMGRNGPFSGTSAERGTEVLPQSVSSQEMPESTHSQTQDAKIPRGCGRE